MMFPSYFFKHCLNHFFLEKNYKNSEFSYWFCLTLVLGRSIFSQINWVIFRPIEIKDHPMTSSKVMNTWGTSVFGLDWHVSEVLFEESIAKTSFFGPSFGRSAYFA